MGIARSWGSPDEQLPLTDRVEVDFQKGDTRESAVAKIGKVDALIVTAGYGHPGLIWNLPPSEIEKMVWANLHLPALIMQAAVHCTKHVVLTASIAGVRPREGSAVYSSTKAGVLALADVARRELPDHCIQTISFDNINNVGPRKVMAAYLFLAANPGNFDVSLSR